MTNLNDYINIAVDNFEKVIIFKFFNALKKYYDNSPEKYIQVTNLLSKTLKTPDDLKLINQFNSLFQIDKLTIEKIITKPRINGIRTRITTKVLKIIEERGIIKRFNHRNINYKSGKSFTMCNAYIVDTNHIQNYFNNKNIANPSSDFYTKKQCKLITKFILENNKSEDTIVKNNLKENNMKAKQPKQKTIKQKVVHPENDIQPSQPKSNVINRLQEFIDKKYIGRDFAEKIYKTIYPKSNIKFKEPNGGVDNIELQKHLEQKFIILNAFINDYKNELTDEEKTYWIKEYKILEQIKK
jgi:hypothetical protein